MSEKAPFGVVFDFFVGCRVVLPAYSGKIKRKVRIYDHIAPPYEIEFGHEQKFISTKLGFFIKYKLEILEGDQVVWSHNYDCRDKKVVVRIGGALGDTIAWIPYIEHFREIHGCNMIVGMNREYIPLFRNYPYLNICDEKMLDDKWVAKNDIYASYILSYRSDDNVCVIRTIDSRQISLSQVAQDTLGLDCREILKPNINVMAPNRAPLKDKYVVISASAGGIFKLWNNPDGWSDVVQHLTDRGFRVVCIDRYPVFKHWPKGLEDQTGNRPLTERARWLAHSELLIGLGSGLSWLAWALDKPVVMVAGFSLPYTEFENPFRVINTDVCHGCWNDMSIPPPSLYDYEWCPRHKGTEREYECSKLITSKQVIDMVDIALLIQRRLETIDHDIENGRDAEDVLADLRQRIKAN